MAKTVNIQEAKGKLSNLVARAEAGEEVVIARANKPAVRLVPVRPRQRRRIGEAKGLLKIPSDFEVLPDEFMGHFR